MKKVLTFVGYAVLAVVVVLGGFAAYVAITGIPSYSPGHVMVHVDVTPENVAHGRKYMTLLCATCHMDPTTGRLTGKRIVDLPAQFGIAYSKNITQDRVYGIGNWTDGEIAYLLRTGIDRRGQYVPPWMPKFPHMSDDDLTSLIAFLRSSDPLVAPVPAAPPGVSQPSFLSKLLTHVAFRPLPYPQARITTPPISDKVAYGRYVSSVVGCYGCHSADFKTMNELEPENSGGYMGGGNPMPDQSGEIVPSANITFDESGIGRWTEADFTRAVRTGVTPDRTVLGYPMVPMPELTEVDTAALYAYLQTVPKIGNRVPRAERRPAPTDTDGNTLYHKYGCTSCHGEQGVGIGDLRHAVEHYPTDPQLEAWIRDAPALKPGTKMPTWNGVIRETDYAPLIEYVKELGRATGEGGR